MKKTSDEFLRLLCDSCGAVSARLRVVAHGETGEHLLLDQTSGASAGIGMSTDTDILSFDLFSTQRAVQPSLSLHELSRSSDGPGCSFYSGGADPAPVLTWEGWSLVSVKGAALDLDNAVPERRNEDCGACGAAGGGWSMYRRGDSEWGFTLRRDGLRLELSVYFANRYGGFLSTRLTNAVSFLGLLESLVTRMEIDTHARGQGFNDGRSLDPPLVGVSGSISVLRKLISEVAECDVSLLIEGESGTGKEIIARNVHRLSHRRYRPLVIVNCMEVPPSLLQSELFGHLKGSFTGATRDRIGLIESANGGTFFLDEIGEMPLSLQATLLRVLQEKEVRRIGESRRRTVDVRFIFATNRNLSECVRQGKFREDLYYRVNGVRLFIPALSERKEDILPLAEHFFECCSRAAGRLGVSFGPGGESPAPTDSRCAGISVRAAQLLLAYHWPGNVRELRNEIERIVALNRGVRVITPRMLSPHIGAPRQDADRVASEFSGSLPAALERLERRMIDDALELFGGNRTRTARALGLTRQGLLKKIKRYGLVRKG